MSHATTTYEKLLEEQNDKLRESIEKLIVDNDELTRKLSQANLLYTEIHDGVDEMISSAIVSFSNEARSRRSTKEYKVVRWSCNYYPDSSEPPKHMRAIYPIMRKHWLDYLESTVKGMKRAVKNDASGGYTFYPNRSDKFPTLPNPETPEVTKP